MKRKILSLAILALLVVVMLTSIVSKTTAKNSLAIVENIGRIHQQDLPVMSPGLAEISLATDVKGQSVTYGTLDGKSLKGYLASPSKTKTDSAALIVIHEWWGLNDNIKKMTETLASEGYTALAVDLYDGNIAANPDQAKKLLSSTLQDSQKINNNLQLAYQYLDQEQKVARIGSIGWCIGGRWSLQTALLFPTQLKATVIYYGAGMETNPALLKTLQMPILGIFGELDQNPSVNTVQEFEAALKSQGKSVEIHIYPNADHAFANPSGTRYNESAAKDAWEKTIAFLHRNL